MKLKATLAVAALILAPALHAFTLDFSSSLGSSIPADLTVNVPGYGDVSFAAGYNVLANDTSLLNVGTAFFGAPSLQFDNGESVIVTFLGTVPSNVDFNTIAVSAVTGEDFVVLQTGPSQFVLTLTNSPDGAGIGAVTFNADAVPEPSAALLGLIGAGGLVLRRRR